MHAKFEFDWSSAEYLKIGTRIGGLVSYEISLDLPTTSLHVARGTPDFWKYMQIYIMSGLKYCAWHLAAVRNCERESKVARRACPMHFGRCRRDFGGHRSVSKTTNNSIFY